MVFDRVIQEVCEASQVDFEEGGVDQQTLEDMRKVSGGSAVFLCCVCACSAAASPVESTARWTRCEGGGRRRRRQPGRSPSGGQGGVPRSGGATLLKGADGQPFYTHAQLMRPAAFTRPGPLRRAANRCAAPRDTVDDTPVPVMLSCLFDFIFLFSFLSLLTAFHRAGRRSSRLWVSRSSPGTPNRSRLRLNPRTPLSSRLLQQCLPMRPGQRLPHSKRRRSRCHSHCLALCRRCRPPLLVRSLLQRPISMAKPRASRLSLASMASPACPP